MAMRPQFIMLVGVAGAGKSTFARNLSELRHYEICSSDAIRGELWGDESDQREPNKVFQVMLERTRAALSDHRSIIYDAANIEEKYRLQILQQISPYDCHKVCVVFIERPEECIARQDLRDRKVPEHVIWRQIRKFQTPHYCEGWDEIIILNPNAYGDMEMIKEMNKTYDFDQCNPHHTLALDKHNVIAGTYGLNQGYSAVVCNAAFLHDFGKVYTQTFDEKGVAHYYNHENVSAYFYFLLTCGISKEAIETSWLITHHMDFFKGEQYMKKLKARVPEYLYTALEQLHDCDLKAH